MPSSKINRILGVIFIACLMIVLRIWHLGVIQREAQWIESQKPQARTLIQKAERGWICDRFHIPLAINKICYNAVVYYGQMTQIPSVCFREDADGIRSRCYPRREYIRTFSHKLSSVLDLDAERLEDLIYSKASFFPHVPFPLKSDLSEEEYYCLKGLERDFPGLQAEIATKRFYPLQKVASHLIGTMGAIGSGKYQKIVEELAILGESAWRYEQGIETALPPGYASFEAVALRLQELREKSYTLNDLVGQSGIEGQCEEELRGFYGKKKFEIDLAGRLVKELPGGRGAIAGRQIVLSLSAELQQYAEELLGKSEKEREGRSFGIDPKDGKRKVQKEPWIRGGAIVALEPNSGEVLAMASFPRFNPNDFIPSTKKLGYDKRQKRLSRWLENEKHIAALWDGEEPLVRERFERYFVEEASFITWDFYLDRVLPKEGALRLFFRNHGDVQTAIFLQEDFEAVRFFSEIKDPLRIMEEIFSSASNSVPEAQVGAARERLKMLLGAVPTARERLFAIDLCRLVIDSTRFSDALIAKLGTMKLGFYRELCQHFLGLEKSIVSEEREKFRKGAFSLWRKDHQKAFLADKRREEKERKTYVRPYIDYLDRKESELFHAYWGEKRLELLKARIVEDPKFSTIAQGMPLALFEEFLRTFRSFKELDLPLLGSYRKRKTEKDLAAAFYPQGGFGYLRSYAFQSAAPQGSLFKLVTSYESLRQGAQLILTDRQDQSQIVAYAANGTPYPRMYKGGRLPRSSRSQIGKIDLAGALEQTSNPFFSILAGDYLADPDDLKNRAAVLGYGAKSGIELPGETAGNLPTDLKTNRTGLYSFAIGQHTLLATPLQAAGMLGVIANGGTLFKPKIVLESVGLSPDRKALSAFSLETGFASQELTALGVPFSLFTGVQGKSPHPAAWKRPVQIRRSVPLSPAHRMQLIEGMDRVVWGSKGSAHYQNIQLFRKNPSLLPDYLALQHQMIGKTGTAEVLWNPDALPLSVPQMYKHAWFGAVSFSPHYPVRMRYDYPELVVVILLRYGESGKEAAPLAAQMIQKWREIQKNHRTD
ncbi:MAG: hypothetical protein HY861_01810 [Chlamydiia bacterium]|nr:hypothetical protein [Chlamydiia bacterium]